MEQLQDQLVYIEEKYSALETDNKRLLQNIKLVYQSYENKLSQYHLVQSQVQQKMEEIQACSSSISLKFERNNEIIRQHFQIIQKMENKSQSQSGIQAGKQELQMVIEQPMIKLKPINQKLVQVKLQIQKKKKILYQKRRKLQLKMSLLKFQMENHKKSQKRRN